MAFHLGWKDYPQFLLNPYWQISIVIFVLSLLGYRYFLSSYRSLKNKTLGMDFLVAFATSISLGYSLFILINDGYIHHNNIYDLHYYFDVAVAIIVLIGIGRYFEQKLSDNISNNLLDLNSLYVDECIKLENNKEVKTKVKNLQINDLVKIKTNDLIPIDGVIYQGDAQINEALLTGESNVIAKTVNNNVYAGTSLVYGEIILKVQKTIEKSMLSEIIDAVEMSQANKPSFQRWADKISSIFIPTIFVISIITFFLWMFTDIYKISDYFSLNFHTKFMNMKKGWEGAINASLTLMVISCPCSIGLAAPLSILIAVNSSHKKGIIFKNILVFEKLKKITHICFDKTGTLTEGDLKVTKVFGSDQHLSLLKNNLYHSHHPVAQGIFTYLNQINPSFIQENNLSSHWEEIPGKGISFIEADHLYKAGSYNYLLEEQIKINKKEKDFINLANEQKKALFFFFDDKKIINIFVLEDTLKANSQSLITELKKKIEKIYLISGDSKEVVSRISNQLGIDYYSETKPSNKSLIVKSFQEKEGYVLFVGDGINDSIALTQANLSIAIGKGAGVVNVQADIILINEDIFMIKKILDISQITNTNIKQNFTWAFFYNLLAVPIAILGILNPIIAAFLMGMSDVFVILNAQRLRYKIK